MGKRSIQPTYKKLILSHNEAMKIVDLIKEYRPELKDENIFSFNIHPRGNDIECVVTYFEEGG